jgi:glycogen debranching enzyme
MAMANDMSLLLTKIERRLGLTPLMDALPAEIKKDKWADVIMQDTIVTFSRYYPHKFKMQINDETVVKRKDSSGVLWYYIKDEILDGIKLLGIRDIDWTDISSANSSLTNTSLAGGYYYPQFACPEATLESIMTLQMNANISSLYNRQIYIDFEYPNRFCLKGLANTNYDFNSFVVILLIEHRSLSTISPTKMEAFESLAIADVANFLWKYLRYYDGLNTIYIDIDLKLSELEQEAQKRDQVIEKLADSYVSTSNDNIPYIMTI